MPAIQLSARLAELFSSAAITGYYDDMRETVRPYLGEALFPNARTSGMELKSISGKAGPPVVLRTAAFDTHAPIRPRIPFKQMSHEMPFFREAMTISEKERQELRIALQAGDEFATHIIERIYGDQFLLLLGADAAVERMRMMLLATGFIQAVIDGVPMDYDYGFDVATQMTTLVGAATWNTPATSTPIDDLREARKTARLANARVILTEETYDYMLQSTQIMGAMFPSNFTPSYVLPEQKAEYLSKAAKVEFITLSPEENTFRERVNGDDQQFFPDGTVTLLPAGGAVGQSYYGVTPEESDLMGGENLDVTVTAAGVAVVAKVNDHPVNHETRVSQIALPVIERIDRMHIINVY